MKCDQCLQVRINGVLCHEHGCPNFNKVYDEENERWVRLVKCICGDYHLEDEGCAVQFFTDMGNGVAA